MGEVVAISGSTSRNKGKRGEREVVRFIKTHFPEFEAVRGAALQAAGNNELPDVVVRLPMWHNYTVALEVKRRKQMTMGVVKNGLSQAREAAKQMARNGMAEAPVGYAVAHRGDRETWLVTVPLDMLLTLIAGMKYGLFVSRDDEDAKEESDD